MNKIYLLISFIIIIALNIFSQTENKTGADSSKYNIDNCINTFTLDKTEKTKAGYQYWFADKNFLDGRTIKLSVVRPHEATHAPHVHPEDEFFFVLEGTAEFYLNGKTRIVAPMTSLYCPSNFEHGIKNAGDTELKYLVIKKYNIAHVK